MAYTIPNELDLYFNWLEDLAFYSDPDNEVLYGRHYKKLLEKLFTVEFTWDTRRAPLNHDGNRAADGLELRDIFVSQTPYFSRPTANPDIIFSYLGGRCSVLEMMIALARRLEVNIMSNPAYGNRISVWFMEMMKSSGMDYMDDNHYSEIHTNDILTRLLYRNYAADGRGCLFDVREPLRPLEDTEIWYQAMWWITEREKAEGNLKG